jgi:subtilisin family serine protease
VKTNLPQDGARQWASFETTRVSEDTFRLRKRSDVGKTVLEMAADSLGPLAGLGVVQPDFLAEIVPNERPASLVACEAQVKPSQPDGGEVKVAILDTGFPLHDCLHWNVGFDAIGGQGEITREKALADKNGHGTFCAGLIAANCPGTFFGANSAVNLLPVRVADENGCANVSDIARGLSWARKKDAEIASISLVSESRSRVLEREILRSRDRMLVVAAVGNFDHRNLDRSPYYPAAIRAPNLFAVGGFGCSKRIGSFGHLVDALAPGDNVLSLKGKDRFESRSGTSVAAAIAAGQASLLEAAAHRMRRHLAPRKLRILLLMSSRQSPLPEPEGAPSSCSRGILDLANALQVLAGRGKSRNVFDCVLTRPF